MQGGLLPGEDGTRTFSVRRAVRAIARRPENGAGIRDSPRGRREGASIVLCTKGTDSLDSILWMLGATEGV